MGARRTAPAAVAPGGAEGEVARLLERHGLGGAPAAVVYLSFADPDSGIAAYDAPGRLSHLIGLLPLPLRGDRLVAAVAGIDDNGPRLVENYRRAFPLEADALGAFEPGVELRESAAPGWLLAACSLALGLTEAEVDEALEPSGEVLGLDTFVIERRGGYVLDTRRLLRSLMSYRIGGAPTAMLARSVLASLGRFSAGAIERLLRDFRAEAIACVGDLFDHNLVLLTSARDGLRHLGVPLVDPRCAPGTVAGHAPGRSSPAPAVAVSLTAPPHVRRR